MTDSRPPGAARRRRADGIVAAVGVGALVVAVGAAIVLARSGDGQDGAARSVAGAGGDATTATTTPTTPTTAGTPPAGPGARWAPAVGGRTALRGFGEVAVTITHPSGRTCEACLLSAVSEAQRRRGLMEVTDPDLGGYDGMLFEYPSDVSGGFWMRNTPMPLSVAYADQGLRVVTTTDMTPCADSPSCPTYPPGRPFRYALEVTRGRLAGLGIQVGSTVTIDGRTCPAVPGAH